MEDFSKNQIETRKGRDLLEKILFNHKLCSVCFSQYALVHWDHLFNTHNGDGEEEVSLKEIIHFSFEPNVQNMCPTTYFCETCVDTILKTYKFVKGIHETHLNLQQYSNVITQHVNKSLMTVQKTEQKLLLTIDNVNKLQVPTTVTVEETKTNINKIILYEETTVAQTEFRYECAHCTKRFAKLNCFNEHYVVHAKETSFSCRECSKKFNNFHKLIDHRSFVHSDNLTACNVCQVILLNIEINEHEAEHKDHVFICDFCLIMYNNKTELTKHIQKKHVTVEITCQHCLKTFYNKHKMNHHRCRFKCVECKDYCIHEEYLRSYREQYLQNRVTFSCIDCDYSYTQRNELICHVNEKHLNYFPYLCDLCGNSFASQPLLRTHMYKIHATKPKIIDSISIIKYQTYEMADTNFTEEIFETNCRFCLKVFSNIGKLNLHVKRHHPDEINSTNLVYACSMCESVFEFRTDYLIHLETHPKGTKHICRECNKLFPTVALYSRHLRKHKIKFDKECPICLKKYTKHSISRHIKNHLAEERKKSMCANCGEVMPNEKALIKHSAKHKEVAQCPHCKKFVNCVLYSKHIKSHTSNIEKHMKKTLNRSCSDCDYTTKFPVCLEAHINRHHLKIRPYQCDVCSKKFYSEHTMKGHKAIHTEERPEHYCEICGNRFISKKALILHTRIHTGEQPYPCEMCDLSFLSASRRRQHVLRKHCEKSFECEMCNKKYYTKSDLKRHITDCHDEVRITKARKTDFNKSDEMFVIKADALESK